MSLTPFERLRLKVSNMFTYTMGINDDENIETNIGIEIEKALHDFITEVNDPSPMSFKSIYIIKCIKFHQAMINQEINRELTNLSICGIISRQGISRDLINEYLGSSQDSIDNRQIYRDLFAKNLEVYFNKKISHVKIIKMANAIEESCYHAIIQHCRQSHSAHLRSWKSQTFINLYSTRCGIVNANIDCNSSIVKINGTNLLDNLYYGIWLPSQIGYMSSAELCPKAAQSERDEIKLRLDQRVIVKESRLYECPNCHGRKCSYREVQTRSSDEPADIFCICLNEACGHRFKGNH